MKPINSIRRDGNGRGSGARGVRSEAWYGSRRRVPTFDGARMDAYASALLKDILNAGESGLGIFIERTEDDLLLVAQVGAERDSRQIKSFCTLPIRPIKGVFDVRKKVEEELAYARLYLTEVIRETITLSDRSVQASSPYGDNMAYLKRHS